MRRICIGILAHVDAGKTTLSEAILYKTGSIRALGRVDHRDAFLDTDQLERQRGITIYAKQAVFPLEEQEATLLDTPGHVDFSAEMERTLQVLDCAILVISGTDGVQAHTRTLWRLLERHRLPVFLFVNKMDLPGTDRDALLSALRTQLGEGCVDFGGSREALLEEAATAGEEALTEYLDTGDLSRDTLAGLVASRALFPCWFGSALRLEGVDQLLAGLAQYCPRPSYPADFGARVYKIGRDSQGNRLTYMKITGGRLTVKQLLTGLDESGEVWEEKAEQLRIYSGVKYRAVDSAEAGTVCAVTGLTRTHSGQGLGAAAARGHGPPHGPGQAPGPGGGGPPAPPPVEPAAGPDPPPAHGPHPAGGAAAGGGAAVRPGGGLRPRGHRVQGDHRRPGGGRGPLRAPAPLRRGPAAAGARPQGHGPAL